MDDLWTKKRGFVNPTTSEISRSPVSGMSFSDSQRKSLGGLSFLKTYHTTGNGDEIIMKSFGNVTSIDIKEPIVSRESIVKSEYLLLGSDDVYWYIHIFDSKTLQETSRVNIGSTMDFWGYGTYGRGGYPGNPVWDHQNKCFVVAIVGTNEDLPGHPGADGNIREGRILCFNEQGSLLSNRELFSFDDTYPNWPGKTIIRLGNAITINNNVIKDKIWASVYYSAFQADDQVSRRLYSITNGSASIATNTYHGVAMDNDGKAVTVYGSDYTYNYDYWENYSGIGIEKGDIYKAIIGPDDPTELQTLKLYDADGNMLINLGNYTTGSLDYVYGILTYMTGTNLLCHDVRGLDTNWPPSSLSCGLITLSGVNNGEITGPSNFWKYTSYPQNGLGVGERVTIY